MFAQSLTIFFWSGDPFSFIGSWADVLHPVFNHFHWTFGSSAIEECLVKKKLSYLNRTLVWQIPLKRLTWPFMKCEIVCSQWPLFLIKCHSAPSIVKNHFLLYPRYLPCHENHFLPNPSSPFGEWTQLWTVPSEEKNSSTNELF